MADTGTARTAAALLALFGGGKPLGNDQDEWQIGPQDIRDLIESTASGSLGREAASYAQLTINADTGGQAITTAFEIMTEWDVASVKTADMTAVTTGTITPADAGTYVLDFSGSLSGASAHTTFVQFAVDGTEEGPLCYETHASTTAGQLALRYIVTLTAAQALTVSIQCAASETITFHYTADFD